MYDLFCTDCEHAWSDLDHDGCPNCGGRNVIMVEQDLETFDDGHYEGDFYGRIADDEVE